MADEEWQWLVSPSQGEDRAAGKRVAYVLDFDEAHEAAELGAIIEDLDFVIEIYDHLLDRSPVQEKGKETEEDKPVSIEDQVNSSLWIAALTAYGRCFLKGVRYSLPESLFLRTLGMDYTHAHRLLHEH